MEMCGWAIFAQSAIRALTVQVERRAEYQPRLRLRLGRRVARRCAGQDRRREATPVRLAGRRGRADPRCCDRPRRGRGRRALGL